MWLIQALSPRRKGGVKQTEHSDWVFILYWTTLLQNDLSFKEKYFAGSHGSVNDLWLQHFAIIIPSMLREIVYPDVYLFTYCWCGNRETLQKKWQFRVWDIRQSNILCQELKGNKHRECILASMSVFEKVTLAFPVWDWTSPWFTNNDFLTIVHCLKNTSSHGKSHFCGCDWITICPLLYVLLGMLVRSGDCCELFNR